MRNGGLPSVALLPPQQKASPSVHDLASRLQPSSPPPPPHTQQGKGGDHAVKDAGTRLPKRHARRPFSPPACRKKEAASSSRPPNSLTLATTHHPPPLHSTDIMSSKRGRGGTTGAKFRMTLGLPVAAVINCAGKWVLGVGWGMVEEGMDVVSVCKKGTCRMGRLCVRVCFMEGGLSPLLFLSYGGRVRSHCESLRGVYVRWRHERRESRHISYA